MNKAWMSALLVSAPLCAGEAPTLELQDAWIRALPPTQTNTAGYLTLHNPGQQVVRVTGGRAELAGSLEIHTSREVEGYMRMEQLPALDVPPGGSVSLAPGGTHLMLLDLERMPAAGETLQLCLATASGDEVCTSAEVRRGGSQDGHHHHHP